MTLATAAKERRYIVKDQSGRRVGEAHLSHVAVDDIRLDPSYQRDASQPWINEHLPFDPDKCGAIILSQRGGTLWVIDGQHRWRLAQASGVRVIAALVIEGLTKKDEAEHFRNYQVDRRALSAWSLWRAELVAELPEAMNIQAAVLRAGFKVRQKREDDHTILTIDSLRRVYRLGGGDRKPEAGQALIEATLGWISSTWLGEEMALSRKTIYGVALFLWMERPRPEFDPSFLQAALKKNSPSKIDRYAQALAARRKATSASPTDFAEAIVEQYDKLAPEDHRLFSLKPRRKA